VAMRRGRPSRGAIETIALRLTLLSFLLLSCAPLQTPRIFKIGMVAPFEGRYRDIGYDAVYAARLAVREINAAGGVGGWRLELVAYDDRGEPELAARAAGKLAVDPDVVAVIGHYRPETSATAEAIYARQGLPYLVIGGWGEGDGATRYLTASPDALAQAIVDVAEEQGLTSGTVWGTGPLAEALTARGWAGARPEAPEEPGDLVVSLLDPAQGGEWLAHWRRQAWTGQLVGGIGLASPTFGQIAGADAAGAQFVTPYPFPQDLEGMAPWMDAYRSMGPHVPDPGPYALPTYEAITLIAEAVAAARVPERAAVGQALATSHRQGRLGEISWDAQGYWREAPLYRYVWGVVEGVPCPRPPRQRGLRSPEGGGSSP
jgi:branched-chain amino acid transport system substrate-binding protein